MGDIISEFMSITLKFISDSSYAFLSTATTLTDSESHLLISLSFIVASAFDMIEIFPNLLFLLFCIGHLEDTTPVIILLMLAIGRSVTKRITPDTIIVINTSESEKMT